MKEIMYSLKVSSGMSYKDMAKKTGINLTRMFRLLNGSEPVISEVILIEDAFGIDLYQKIKIKFWNDYEKKKDLQD